MNRFEEHLRSCQDERTKKTQEHPPRRWDSGAYLCLAQRLSDYPYSLLQLPQKFRRYGVSCVRLHSLAKTLLSNLYAGHALK